MSQKAAILAALKKRQALTPLDALRRWGCLRLAARIQELREEGWPIDMDRSKGYGKYRLVK